MFKKRLVLVAIFIATFMTSIETTIVTTAMPTIISELHGLSIQSWVFAAYLLTTAIATPIYGKFSDRVGRKPIFMMGLALFITGSFLCGFASNMMMLIIFRIIQGIGAGAVMPLTFTIIADLFDFKERARIFALNNSAWAISALGGPLLGGYIVDFLNWHWIFFINVPLGLITIFLTLFAYKEEKQERKASKIDYPGIISLTIMLLMLLLVFQGLGNTQINWLLEVVELLVFVISFLSFFHFEKKAEDPIIQLKLFKNYSFSAQIMTSFLLSSAIISYQIYFPIWLQSIYRTPAYLAGVAITPSSVMWMIASFFVGTLMAKSSSRKTAMIILAVLFIVFLPLAFAGTSFPQFLFYVIAGVSGAGVGIIVSINTLLAQKLVPKENVGLSSSMVVLARTLGQALMTGIYGLAFTLGVHKGLARFTKVSYDDVNNYISSAVPHHFSSLMRTQLSQVTLHGLRLVFMVVLVLFVLAFIVNLLDKNSHLNKG